MILSSIDLGTNTFRLLIARTEDHRTDIILRESLVTGLGKNFNPYTKSISAKSIQNSLNALKNFSSILSNYKIDFIRIVATSVVREASNSDEFIIPAQSILKNKIDVITGSEETELTVNGVVNSINYKGNKLIVDIGGGSTEFAFVSSNNTIESSKSTEIGVVKYSDRYDFSRKMNMGELQDVYRDINSVIIKNCDELGISPFDNFEIIVTAGTPTTLAAIDMNLIEYDHDLVNNYKLSKENIRSIIYKLTELDSKERLKIPGMHAGRENLLIPGALIILSLLDKYKKNNIIVSDGGLLEGVLYKNLRVSNIAC